MQSKDRMDADMPPSADPGVDACTSSDSRVAELVAAAQSGDADAFGQLYADHRRLVYRYVRPRVDTYQLAQDFTSDTFLRAWRAIGSYGARADNNFEAWLVTIARNLVHDHYKAARTRSEHLVQSYTEMLDSSPWSFAVPTGDTPEGALLAHAERSAVLQAVLSLSSAVQRQCIVLRFLQGLTVAETSAAMGKDESCVKSLQHRAIRALAKDLRLREAIALAS